MICSAGAAVSSGAASASSRSATKYTAFGDARGDMLILSCRKFTWVAGHWCKKRATQNCGLRIADFKERPGIRGPRGAATQNCGLRMADFKERLPIADWRGADLRAGLCARGGDA